MIRLLSKISHNFLKKIIGIPLLTGEQAASVIKDELISNKPSMIARFGSNEIKAVLYPKTYFPFNLFLRRIMNYDSSTQEFINMKIGAGFFPSNRQTIHKFSVLMYQDIKQLDILGSWRFEERFLQPNFSKAKIVRLDSLEPYLQKNPWSEVLENKDVLVIHPFNKTIERQYENKRKFLFKDSRILPQFKSLQTIKAVQSIAGNTVGFKDWFEALDFMKTEINKKDFDIAIIGAGAYGFPLAAHIKRIGKKAVHMGGPTQMLFGIKGKRWIDNEKFKDIINEHFIFPSDTDKVEESNKVEDGCYW